MSMQKFTLDDFIATVPVCVQNASIAVVVDIFSQGQCDRLVVVNEQQYPIGVLSLRRLMPQMMSAYGQQASLDQALVEPIATLPAALSVEQFGIYLHSQTQTNIGSEWALVGSDGKFLGLLDSPRLLQLLALSPAVSPTTEPKRVERRAILPPDSPNHRHGVAPDVLDSLVQLLERLPWPLRLQTGTGEMVMQNPAWGQHFGALSDPEAVRREVEDLLENSFTPEAESKIHSAKLQSQKPESVINLAAECSSSRCQLSTQPGVCICVCPMQNGQERVWQFVKIRLQETLDKRHKPAPCTPDLWLLWANDVTEQQQLASELVAKNADLIQLNRLKDEFLACISHELRTPLTAVLGLSTLLKDQNLGQLNERQARYARLIHENGRQLMTVVNDILDLTRMETGQMELTLEPVKITTVCDRAIEQLKAIQSKTKSSATASEQAKPPYDHRFTLSIEPGLDTFVADELRLRQMLCHLLSNAFKFTEAVGEIGLRVSYWEGWIAFTVWDTGIGIPELKQHLIFQKFQQLENPLTRQFEGTGLGLVLTRALARLHGGDVSFISTEGKGSQFTLLLPPHPPQKGVSSIRRGEFSLFEHETTDDFDQRTHNVVSGESAAVAGKKSQIKHKRKRKKDNTQHITTQNRRNRLVLVVEAAPRFIEELTEQLTGLGYWVVIARSGTEALEKVRRLQPGAVFLNPLLPLLSGWDVLTLLKADATTSQIPAIVTSTRAEKDKAFFNRADEFLNLPVQPQGLQQILARFCPKPAADQLSRSVACSDNTDAPLTILKLVSSHSSPPEPLELLKQDGSFYNEVVQVPLSPDPRNEPHREPHAPLLNKGNLPMGNHFPTEEPARSWGFPPSATSVGNPASDASLLGEVSPQQHAQLSYRTQLALQRTSSSAHDCPPAWEWLLSPQHQSQGSCYNGGNSNSQSQGDISTRLAPKRETSHPAGSTSPLNYRVLEADDLEQAELLARIWQPDVALITQLIPEPLAYLQQLSQHSALAALPLVTLDAATTEAANQVAGLSVFPCLTPIQDLAIDTLLSVLQIAAGMNWEHSVLVVDVATLLALSEVKSDEPEKTGALNSSASSSLGSEWFQALIQYLHTAGLRGLMAHSWAEVLQQIRQQSIDLLLLCFGESKLHPSVVAALRALEQQDDLPPVLVLDQRLSQGEVREQIHLCKQEAASTEGESLRHPCDQTDNAVKPSPIKGKNTTDTASDAVESLETVLSAIATEILPHSLSMEELLDHIHQTLISPLKTSGKS